MTAQEFLNVSKRRQNYEYRQRVAKAELLEALKETEDTENAYFDAWSKMRDNSQSAEKTVE